MNKEVYECFNANIIRLFKESKEPTISFCGEYIVNMSSGSSTYDEQIKEILQYAKEVYNIDAEELSKELCSRKARLHTRRVSFNNFKEGMNGYISAKQKVQEDLDLVLKYKWRLTKFEKNLYSEFLPQEMRIIPDNQEKKDDTPIWIYVIAFIIVLALLILIAPVLDVLFPWLLVFGFMFWLLGKY